jgi:hypothetical protein
MPGRHRRMEVDIAQFQVLSHYIPREAEENPKNVRTASISAKISVWDLNTKQSATDFNITFSR